MHLSEEWLAVVRREVLEIYLTPSHSVTGKFDLWKSLSLSRLIGAATFSMHINLEPFTPAFPSLRLCISCDDGIFVYKVLCNIEESLLSLDLLWQHIPESKTQTPPKYFASLCPSLGVTGGSVSWLSGDVYARGDRFTFSMERVPSNYSSKRSQTFEWFDENMPIQSAIGVRDVDEARGLAVFGNAFGELCLYDFGTSSFSRFEDYYKHYLCPSPHIGDELLPTVCLLLFKLVTYGLTYDLFRKKYYLHP